MTYRLLVWVLAPIIRLLWRLEVSGLDRLPTAGCVVVSNHDSVLDPFFLAAALPRQIHFVGKRELWRSPFLAPVLRSVGAIPVSRGEGDVAALADAVAVLEAGEIVGLFPEGTVLHHEARRWRRGAARLALAAGVPLVPIRLIDSERAFRPVKRELGFPVVRVVVGEPIVVERTTPTPERATELTEKVRAAVFALGPDLTVR